VAALRRVLRLAPAAAMRPPAPPTYRHALLERLGLARWLSPRGRMVLRGVSSRPIRFVLATLGAACAFAIVVLGLCWRDALDYMTSVQFALAERGDATVAFVRPVTMRTVREVAHLPGILEAEGYRAVPVQLRAGHRRYRTAVLGVPRAARLRRLLDPEARPVTVPEDGLLLTRQLAERLALRPGDTVVVDVREGKRPRRNVVVAGLVDDLVGLSAYMDREALNRLLQEGDVVNAATVRIEGPLAPQVHARFKELGGIATVAQKRRWLEVFEQTTATFVLFFSLILTAFAVAIAVGVVYNTARVALQERAWELASLRVLGFTRAEVSALLLGESSVALLLALPLGAALGWGAAWAVLTTHQTETFRVPVVVAPRTFAWAALVMLGAGVASALLVRRRLDRLDLVAVLKTRE
jgi:putative ABC transport system permease protein